MFTGIVEEVGTIATIRKLGGGIRFTIEAPVSAAQLHINDSVSVNGVCQTAIMKVGNTFDVEAVEETLRKTTLADLAAGSSVNLELPLRLNDRLGGHLVQGHVDGVGVVRSMTRLQHSWQITIVIPEEFTKYVIPVGSIAVDGVSLTVASISGCEILLSIIPHTLEKTTFMKLAERSRVNLEFDLIGKYIERLLEGGLNMNKSQLSKEKLKEWGYQE